MQDFDRHAIREPTRLTSALMSKRNRWPATKIVVFLLLVVLSNGAVAQRPKCQVPPQDSRELAEARMLVRKLPETIKWTKSHSLPVAYVGVFKPLKRAGKCFLAIDVYVDHPDHFERWNSFYVNVESKTVLVYEVVNDEVISIKDWRRKARRQADSSGG